ncbi:MAG: hypothetical protein WBA13_12030 [Microcoleaceae cyanobacterium]
MLSLSTTFFDELYEAQGLSRFLKQLEFRITPIPPIQLPPGAGPDPLPFEPNPQPNLETSVDDFILPEGVGSDNIGLIPDLIPDVSNSFVSEIVTTEIPIDVPTVLANSEDFLL